MCLVRANKEIQINQNLVLFVFYFIVSGIEIVSNLSNKKFYFVI